jgi:hypothetical protein
MATVRVRVGVPGNPTEERNCVFEGEVQQGVALAGPVSYLRQNMVSRHRDASHILREHLDMTALDARRYVVTRFALARMIFASTDASVRDVFIGKLRGFIRKNKVNPCLPVYVG